MLSRIHGTLLRKRGRFEFLLEEEIPSLIIKVARVRKSEVPHNVTNSGSR